MSAVPESQTHTQWQGDESRTCTPPVVRACAASLKCGPPLCPLPTRHSPNRRPDPRPAATAATAAAAESTTAAAAGASGTDK